MPEISRTRPGANMRLIEALQYRLPIAGVVSILHRGSGMLMFFLLPFVIWLFDKSVTSEISYDTFASAFVAGIGVVPGVVIKLIVLALIWAYLFHAIAGVRHLWMDATHSVSKQQGRSSAVVTVGLSTVLTVLLGAKLFGLY
ncbi:succinate dehydrogenase, cytochrome b556 subunit [Aquincola sp. S2]|uniref:Succinate dehydrogenase cytochrome b556 subunit n=1 Tax=Pseudaquabacterium terrae TaxID=2732868 RepID=A0ABX2EFI6_9BURK|nr:succinate dehydrogenase, cytochrome b556 subunit [Aquabacterium terrae]NRF67385.1 succinate dehydrogenase, cytochrome b556 subunit [Aquabacterium terrae]